MKINLLAVRDGCVGTVTAEQREALEDVLAAIHRAEEMILNYLFSDTHSPASLGHRTGRDRSAAGGMRPQCRRVIEPPRRTSEAAPRTILVVDDEAGIRRGCERVLRSEGHTVMPPERGDQGLEILD